MGHLFGWLAASRCVWPPDDTLAWRRRHPSRLRGRRNKNNTQNNNEPTATQGNFGPTQLGEAAPNEHVLPVH